MSKVIGAVQVINKLVVTNEKTGDKHFTVADEVIIDSLCQHLRLAIENCNRVEGIESPALRPVKPASNTNESGGTATAAGNAVVAPDDGAEPPSKTVNHTSHMRLSTEALLRFELAHVDYGSARGRLGPKLGTHAPKRGPGGEGPRAGLLPAHASTRSGLGLGSRQ